MPIARQEQSFDPNDHQDPAHALTLELRGLRLGGRVRMPDDTLVLSTSIAVGPHQQRRFVVVPPLDQSTPVERHRIMTLGHGACKTAEQAATKALRKK